MKNRRVSRRFAALNVASLICMSVCFAGLAGAEDAPFRPQTGMATMSNTSQLPFIRPKSGPSPSHIRLDLRAPETIKATDAYIFRSGRQGVGSLDPV